MNRTKKLSFAIALMTGMLFYAPEAMAQSNETWYMVTDKGLEIPVTKDLYIDGVFGRREFLF